MSRNRSIFNKLYGVPPGRDAPKLDRLLWIRSYYLRSLILAAFAIVFVVVFLPAWIVVVVMLPWLIGFTRLSAEIRRERQHR
jgi:hypothetical protein